jgi:hypothetical protein
MQKKKLQLSVLWFIISKNVKFGLECIIFIRFFYAAFLNLLHVKKIIVINFQFKGWRENNTEQYYTRDNPRSIEDKGQKPQSTDRQHQRKNVQ